MRAAGDSYAFAAFRLEARQRLLLRQGRPVGLTPKAFDTLTFLIRNRGRIVTKDEILAAVWPDVVVEEATLSQNIWTLRRALGDSAATPQFIETVPKAGYRFIADVQELDAVDALTVAASRGARFRYAAAWLVTAALVAAALAWQVGRLMDAAPAVGRIAVLPFRSLQAAPGSDFLELSVADAIIGRLSVIPEVTVRPSSSIAKYRDTAVEPATIARELDVDAIVAGSIIRADGRVRVNVELVEIGADRLLWRETFDFPAGGLLAVHDTVAAAVVDALSVRVSAGAEARLARDRPRSAEAYELVLRALDLNARNQWRAAMPLVERALALDPQYAPAWVQAGVTFTGVGAYQGGGAEYMEKSMQAFRNAIAINPDLVEPRVWVGTLQAESGSLEQATPLLQEAVARNPSNALAHAALALVYRYAGLLDESVAEWEEARRLDAFVLKGATMNTFLYLGAYRRFLEALETDESARTTFYRGLGLLHAGDRQRAVEELERAYRMDPSLIHARVGKAMVHGVRGERAAGLEELGRIERDDRPVDGEMLYKVAQAFAVLGAAADASRVLQRAIEQDFFAHAYMERDPLLESVRAAGLIDAPLARARERHQEFRARYRS